MAVTALLLIALGALILSPSRSRLVIRLIVAVAAVSMSVWALGGTAWAETPDCYSAAATSAAVPTTTSTASPTATASIPVKSATLSGTYTRQGFRMVEISPPGSYDTAPISAGGTDWDVPTSLVDAGPVAGAKVDLRLAGADGVLGTADDQLAQVTTDATGRYTFTVHTFGPYRLSITDLPVPDRSYDAVYETPVCTGGHYIVTTWAVTTPAAGSYAQTIAADGAVTGLDFIATNEPSGGFSCM